MSKIHNVPFDTEYKGPIHNLNLFKYKPGGAEAHAEYAKKMFPLVKKFGGKFVYRAEGIASIVGPENWDQITIVEFPSIEIFQEMTKTEEYMAPELMKIREIMIEDIRVLCMKAP